MKKLIIVLITFAFVACTSGEKKTPENSVNASDIVETTINIGSLHCENCVASVTKGISELDGIEKVVVTLSDSTAVVNYDASKVELAELKKAVEKRGFRVKE